MKHLLFLLFFPLFLSAQPLLQVAHADGPVYAIAKHGNVTVIGGKFNNVNGTPAKNFAWTTDQVSWHGVGLGMNDTVLDIAYYNGDFFVCGKFTQADTGANKLITRWSPTTHRFISIRNNQQYVGTRINQFAIVDTLLFACGDWQLYNGTGAYYNIHLYDPTPNQFSFVAPNFNATSLASYNHKLYVSGWTSSVGSTTQWMDQTGPLTLHDQSIRYPGYYYPKFSVVSGYDTYVTDGKANGFYRYDGFNTGTSNVVVPRPIYTLFPQNNTLYAADSAVYTINGSTLQSVFRTNGKVFRMMYDTVMYFAGTFDTVNGVALGNVVKYQLLTPVHAAASYDSVICAGGSVTFTSNSTGSSPVASWSFTGGTPANSSSNSQTVSFSSPGDHQVRLIVSNATSADTAYYTVHVGTPIHLAGPSQISYCAGSNDTIQINGFSGAFTWSPNTGIAASANNFIFGSSSASRYTFYAMAGGCSDSLVVNTTINPLPQMPTISQVDSQLISSSVTGNQWFYNGGILTNSTNQTLTPIQDGPYTVQVKDGNGCMSAMSQVYNYTKPVDTTTTGIDVFDASQNMPFPNPATKIISAQGDFEIIDVNGKSIGPFTRLADITELPTGSYMVVGQNYRKKFIKQ